MTPYLGNFFLVVDFKNFVKDLPKFLKKSFGCLQFFGLRDTPDFESPSVDKQNTPSLYICEFLSVCACFSTEPKKANSVLSVYIVQTISYY
jgi:hypothetical protein